MKKREVFQYFGLLLLFFVPYMITMAVNGIETAVLNRIPDPEEYIPVLLSGQISDDYQKEAIKAQAVIARTNFFRQIEEKELPEILREAGNDLETIFFPWKLPDPVYEKAAEETEGQVLVAGGSLKLVPYHEISGGRTRDGKEVFRDEEYAYLKSVDSSIDKESLSYINSTYISEQQMPSELNIRERDTSGYVMSLTADGNLLEGEAFVRGMGLASSNFTIQKVGGDFRFLCRGKGHGLGFSQNGGNELARKGSTWKEILEVYFPEMETAVFSYNK